MSYGSNCDILYHTGKNRGTVPCTCPKGVCTLTNEEKKKANWARIQALTPRTKEGLLLGVTFEDQKEELLYPYRDLDKNGLIAPMDFSEDYLDGKVPDNLKYAPGYQTEFFPVDDPRYLDSIRYNDPALNLPLAERRVILEYRKNGKVKPMNVRITGNQAPAVESQPAKAEETQTVSVPRSPDEVAANIDAEVINTPYGEMHIRTPQEEILLATFSIEPVEHRLVHLSDNVEDITDEYEICVQTKKKRVSMVIAAKDINNIVDIVQRRLPMCTVSTGIKKANALIVNHVRKQLFALPERHYLKVGGFIKIAGVWVFSHNGAEIPGGNVVFQTENTIPRDPNLTKQGAFRAAMEYLLISVKLALVLPLLLVAHLSPLFNLFAEAGYVPRFVTFLNGRTGSLKTSMALVLFRLYAEQPAYPEANFKDTEVALEIKIGQGFGKVILLDDYRPPVTAADGKNNQAKLESVIRAAGDRIAKSRSNPELGKAKEFPPTSCVVVTGEDLGGTQSSQLRMLILAISKGDIDGKKLKRYQDNPLLLTTHMFYFLKWAGDNGDAIITFIRDNFEAERSFFAESLREGRVIDTAATLMLTARILHAYGTAIDAMDAGSSIQMLTDWRYAILQACIDSEGISKTQNPVCMYLQALFDMIDRKEIEIAADIKNYEAAKHLGYKAGDDLWIWNKQTYERVSRYWQKVGTMFPLTCEKVNEHLESAGLIKVCYEKRGEGVKKLYVCKSSLPSRSRLLVLNEPLAKAYLENESN